MTDDDWRLDNGGEYLRGLVLYYYRGAGGTRAELIRIVGHHCELCSKKFFGQDRLPDALREGYASGRSSLVVRPVRTGLPRPLELAVDS